MKRTTKTILMLASCMAVAVSVAGLSACSLMTYILDGNTSGGGGGGDDPGTDPGGSGTYTLDVAAMDPAWSDNVVDSSLWRTTANIDAYAIDTLVLNEDGTYELTKDMGAGPAAIDRWSSDGGVEDNNFCRYTYYGTYEIASDGVTVTLSECTSIAAEVDVFEMSLGYDLGNYVIEYTETDDLTFGAGTCGDETVVDLMYGPYIADSGRGNCSQTVKLGTYDYGTFTFVEEEDPGEDPGEDPDEPGGEVDTRPSYTFTSGTNSEITFTVYADGTYTFAWDANSVTESGAFTWDRISQTLTITDPAGNEQEVVAENGELAFTYVYSVSDQLTQDYTGSVEELEAAVCEVAYSMIPSADGDISLDLYSDGTYTYADPANSVRETGAYKWDNDGVLTVTKPDGTELTSELSGNLVTLAYSSGSSSETFIGSYAAMNAAMESAEVIYSFTPASNPAIIFELYSDGAYRFAFTTYNTEEFGTWTFESGVLTITDANGKVTVSELDGDVISFTYVSAASELLNQSYTGSAAALAQAMIEAGVTEEIYSFTPGSGNTAISLKFYDNGSYEFGFATYSLTDYGTWSYEGGTLAVTRASGEQFTATVTGDEISLYYNYGGGLDQTFTGSVSGLLNAMLESGMTEEVYSFTPGSGNTAISLKFYDNGSYEFGFATYSLTDYGTWSYEGGTLAVTRASGEQFTATVTGDEISLYYNYGGGLDQTFTGSLSALLGAMIEHGVTEEIYSFTPGSGNTAISLKFYDNGVYQFAFATYSVYDYGTWSYSDGALVVTKLSGEQFTATIAGDEISLYYDFGGGLNQTFTGNVTELLNAMESSGLVRDIYAFTPAANEAIILHLYDNGIYRFAFTTYATSVEYGTWSFEAGVFSVTDPAGTETVANIEGDTISFHYVYSAQSQLTQDYTGSVEALTAAIAGETQTEGGAAA